MKSRKIALISSIMAISLYSGSSQANGESIHHFTCVTDSGSQTGYVAGSNLSSAAADCNAIGGSFSSSQVGLAGFAP
ncbi:hypothetical protein EYS14_07025 [Alteromonadaceae bacterium M269]|nr:hypothetical protein EYS14_07025 [Alteromonadaceae bacterium M269]